MPHLDFVHSVAIDGVNHGSLLVLESPQEIHGGLTVQAANLQHPADVRGPNESKEEERLVVLHRADDILLHALQPEVRHVFQKVILPRPRDGSRTGSGLASSRRSGQEDGRRSDELHCRVLRR